MHAGYMRMRYALLGPRDGSPWALGRIVLAAGLLLSAAVPVAAQSSSAEQAFEAEFDRGYQLQKQGRFKEASIV